MRTFSTFFVLLLLATALPTANFAQQVTEADTIFFAAWDDPCSDMVTGYTINNTWGYVAGTNGYFDLEKAQRLNYNSNLGYLVTEVWGFFDVAVPVQDGPVRMKVYDVNPATNGPGNLLGFSDTIHTSNLNVDPAQEEIFLTVFPLEEPVLVEGTEFFVSCDFADLYLEGDTVSLLMTEENCGSGSDAWELWSDGPTWVPSNDPGGWNSNWNWMLAAVVGFGNTTDVKDPFIAQDNLKLFPPTPNPADQQVRLSYELATGSRVQIELYTAGGQLMQRLDQGQQSPGRYDKELNTTQLPSGAYVFGIVTENERLMSRFVVSH